MNPGEPCAFSECTKEVYLPNTCKDCKKKFCDLHSSPEHHRCPFLNVPQLRTTVCPVCSEVLRVETGESLDHAVNVHFDTGKCSNLKNKKSSGATTTATTNLYGYGGGSTTSSAPHHNAASSSTSTVCAFVGCNALEAVPVTCAACNKRFCLKHKMPEYHDCSKLAKIRTGGHVLGSSSTPPPASAPITKKSDLTDAKLSTILFQASNTPDTAQGIRPGRNVTDGDILVLVTYDAERVKRLVKPVLFSVSPVTPVGRLLDAAVDQYPALQKNLNYTIYSSVSIENPNTLRKQHLLQDQNIPVGDIFAIAAATGNSFPANAPQTNKPAALALCVSVAGGDDDKSQQQQQQDQGSMMTRTPSCVIMTSNHRMAAPNQNVLQSQLRPYTDAKNQIIPILVDAKIACGGAAGGGGGGMGSKKESTTSCGGGDKKKDDGKCEIQ